MVPIECNDQSDCSKMSQSTYFISSGKASGDLTRSSSVGKRGYEKNGFRAYSLLFIRLVGNKVEST